MFLPIIMFIITTLIVSALSSIISSKTNEYELLKKNDNIKEFVFQEKMIKEAVDSYCRINFNVCLASTKATNEIIIPKSALVNYLPATNLTLISNSFSEIKLRTDTKEIFITHSMNLKNRKEYVSHYINKLQNISCVGGEALPCSESGSIVKKIAYSEELKILYVDNNISEKNSIISEKEILINVNSSLIAAESLNEFPNLAYIDTLNQLNAALTNEISVLNQEIVNLNIEKNQLLDIITNRKLKGWG